MTSTKILFVLNHRIQLIKAMIATCEFILLSVIEFIILVSHWNSSVTLEIILVSH